MTKDEICGLLRQIHDVLAMQSETNQVKPTSDYERGVIDGMLKQVQLVLTILMLSKHGD